ncbi:MAG: electron transfer flavoprotein subunit beta/FixA family protein [Gordonibacter sp.]|nr:electron transfer flavoprotein subunit beta/FixA family protein [Gordonibacter sp.]
MNIAVCVKQTVDSEAAVVVGADGRVDTEGQAHVIDPYSEFAVERAVQLVEAQGGSVAVVCIGGNEAIPAVRHALSMGADEGYLVDDEALAETDATGRACVLAAALVRLAPDLVLGGCKSADTSSSQTMPRVAELMSLPCVQVVTTLEVDASAGKARAVREIDDGSAVIEVAMPAVITAQQGLAEPRYPNVRSIMQSKKKPVTVWTLNDLGVDAAVVSPERARTKVVCYRSKPARQGGFIVKGDTVADVVSTTVGLLSTEAKVI